jgi:hypothetical protein
MSFHLKIYTLAIYKQGTYLEFFPSVTSPITEAEGATKEAESKMAGATLSTATNLVDGTSFSVNCATSILAPALSRA